MGFQSSINAMMGSLAGAGFTMAKGLSVKQEQSSNAVQEQRVARQTQTKRVQRRFSSYIPSLIESGDISLNKDMMKTLTSQYTKQQKTQLMNKIDEKGGKQ